MARQRTRTKDQTPATAQAEAPTVSDVNGGNATTLSHKPVEAMPETIGATAAAADAMKETENLGDSKGLEEERIRLAAEEKAQEAALAAGKEAPKKVGPDRFRVANMQDKAVNMNGSRAILRTGKIVDSLNFPIKHLRNQGVQLIPVGDDE